MSHYDVYVNLIIVYTLSIKRYMIQEVFVMDKKLALITGATGGLGNEFAKLHAVKGGRFASNWKKSRKIESNETGIRSSLPY